jgi:hypothetical protein
MKSFEDISGVELEGDWGKAEDLAGQYLAQQVGDMIILDTQLSSGWRA